MSQVLGKGTNAPLPATAAVRVQVSSSTELDVAAILVTPAGKVRSDADFVFFNQPTGPGVRLLPPSGLVVTLGEVPRDIDKIVVTASLDGSGPLTFARVGDLVVSVADGGGGAAGPEVMRFAPSGLSVEAAVLLIEIYRRQGAWKVRAIGQGYASGLAGLATDFGIEVSDPGPSQPAPRQPAPSVRAAGPSDTPPPAYDQPTRVVRPPSAPPPSPSPLPSSPSSMPWPSPPPPAPSGPAGPPPVPPNPQRWGAPVPSADDSRKWGPPGAAEPAAARFDPSRTTTLGPGCVPLRPGQTVALVRASGGPAPNRVRVGLGWEVAVAGENTYLDASCILYDGRGKDVDKVWFMSKKAARGAVRHGGDSVGDRRHGGEEFVHVVLSALPDDVRSIVFTVNSFGGQRFAGIRNIFCRLIDEDNGAELVRFGLAQAEPQTGLVMCKLQRDSSAPHVWTMTAIGEFHDGKTVRAMVGPAKQYL